MHTYFVCAVTPFLVGRFKKEWRTLRLQNNWRNKLSETLDRHTNQCTHL